MYMQCISAIVRMYTQHTNHTDCRYVRINIPVWEYVHKIWVPIHTHALIFYCSLMLLLTNNNIGTLPCYVNMHTGDSTLVSISFTVFLITLSVCIRLRDILMVVHNYMYVRMCTLLYTCTKRISHKWEHIICMYTCAYSVHVSTCLSNVCK